MLDLACGTGKYWGLLREHDLAVQGIDQSQAMLDSALAKYPWASVARCSLQNFAPERQYSAVMCVDALENVPPEDWSEVMRLIASTLAPNGRLYFTVEQLAESELDEAYAYGTEQGFPVVRGEDTRSGGYHYYPSLDEVEQCLAEAGLLVDERRSGDDYWHYLCHKAQ